ncbi:hypothetical protein, partial [Klebsiella pneumoniae]|uniref:hypothetical protein n=1 Tax=Klebsiella pneumoniae TaxID=573 RepID=UPI001C4E7706
NNNPAPASSDSWWSAPAMALKKISKNARRERVFLCDLKSGGKKFTAILSPLNNDIRKKPLA